MTTTMSEPQRIPASLWDAVQEICWRQDQKFLFDVSRILKVPAADIKKRILGTRGVLTIIPTECGPWWTGTQCPVMELECGCMWRRCAAPCEQGDSCWDHRDAKGGLRRYDDPYFTTLPKRRPMRYEGAIYWVADDGNVMNGFGAIMPFRMDLNTKTVMKINGLGLGSVAQAKASEKETTAEYT